MRSVNQMVAVESLNSNVQSNTVNQVIPASLPSMVMSKKTLAVTFGPFFLASAESKDTAKANNPKSRARKVERCISNPTSPKDPGRAQVLVKFWCSCPFPYPMVCLPQNLRSPRSFHHGSAITLCLLRALDCSAWGRQWR